MLTNRLWKQVEERCGELVQWSSEIPRECISNVVRGTSKVIKLRDLVMKALVGPKLPKKIGWSRIGCGAAFVLPKSSIEVVSLTEACAFPDIKCLCQAIKMNKPTSQFKV